MKILLTGDFFHDYEFDIKEGLEANGHSVDLLFNNIHGPFHILDPKTFAKWFRFGLLTYKLKIRYFTDRAILLYNQNLLKMMGAKSYDLLLVIGAKTIFPETVQAFKNRKVLYFMDALHRYPEVLPRLSLFDDLFVFEPTDIGYIKEESGLDAHFLTLAFSPKKYFKKTNSPLLYDFSFVGTYYPKREDYLTGLLDVSDHICIYGDFFRSKNKLLRKKTKKINVPYCVANDLYNCSRINVNIHHPQSIEGLSIRTFEIIGAGGFQLVERQKAALSFFEENEHMAFYDSREEFIDKAKYYLRNDPERKRIAESCHRLALEKHTWAYRMKEMFDILD